MLQGDAECLSQQICDQCFLRRSKCSRQLPTCQRCSNNQIGCTYTRVTRQKAKIDKEPQFYGNTNSFSIKTRFFPRPNRKNPKSSSNSEKSSPSSETSVINYSINVNNWSIIQNSILKDFNSRSIYNILSCMLGNSIVKDSAPPINLINMYFGIFKSKGFAFSRSKLNIEKPLVPTAQLSRYYTVLSEAKTAYFKHLNSVTPLFLESTFEEWHRPPLLMASIWACGLAYLPQTDLIKQLTTSLYSQLLKRFKNSQFKVTFSYFQSMLVLLQGCKENSNAHGFLVGKFEVMAPIIFNFGLHLTPPKKSFNNAMVFERQLAFAATLSQLTGHAYGYGTPSIISFDLVEPYVDLLTPCSALTTSISDKAFAITAQSSYVLACTISKIHELQSLPGPVNFIYLKTICTKLISMVEETFRKSYLQLSSLQQQHITKDDLATVNFTFSSLKIREFTLLQYIHITLFKHYDRLSTKLEKEAYMYLHNAMSSSISVVSQIDHLPASRSSYLFAGACSYAITFLASHFSRHHDPIMVSKYIKLGLDILQRLMLRPGSKFTAGFLLSLSSLIVKSYGILVL